MFVSVQPMIIIYYVVFFLDIYIRTKDDMQTKWMCDPRTNTYAQFYKIYVYYNTRK